MVKTKWTLLKKTFNQIKIYRNVSGFHCDKIQGAGIEGVAVASVWDAYVAPKSQSTLHLLRNNGWPRYDDMQTILGENSGARGCHSFHPATAAPTSVNLDNVLEGADGGLDLLNMDVDPSTAGPSAAGLSDVPDMSTDLMMPPSALFHGTSATTVGSQSGKCLRTNTLLNTLETSSYNSNATPKSSYADSHHSSTLPLSPTLVQSSQSPAFKKARVSAYDSTQTGMSSTAKIAAKITPAAAIMNMQGTINRLTNVIDKNIDKNVVAEPAPVVPAATMISRGLAIMRTGDGDLSVAQRAKLLHIFSHSGGENNLAAYVELEDDFEMHHEFILGLLGSA